MKKSLVIILFFLTLFLVLFFYLWQGVYLPKISGKGEEKVFIIERGEGVREIASNLEKEGLIKSALFFQIFTRFKGISGKLQAGRYLLSSSMKIPEIAKKFVSGNVIKEKITIIEGWNKREIARYLEEKGIVQSQNFLEETKYPEWKNRYSFLKDTPDWEIEGYLFPDTYFVGKRISAEKIISKMLDNFDKKLTPELREEINRQDKSIFEIVTMASMLEREVKTIEDKKLVSGILWKRLEKGIPLQVDATITYITGENEVKISKEDTEIDSPYNTYKYTGLPLGPICNPGLDSIVAAIYPKESDYWYYLSTPDGKTIFSKTLQEHNIAKLKHLK